MSYDWDHQRVYSINEIIKISREEDSVGRNRSLFESLARICIDMKLHGNASALNVYYNIIYNPSEYPELKEAAIHSMNNDGRVGAAGRR